MSVAYETANDYKRHLKGWMNYGRITSSTGYSVYRNSKIPKVVLPDHFPVMCLWDTPCCLSRLETEFDMNAVLSFASHLAVSENAARTAF